MNIEQQILDLKHKHAHTWREKSEWYWLLGLWEEMLELTFTMFKLHRGPVDWELKQISAIAANWLEKRESEQ